MWSSCTTTVLVWVCLLSLLLKASSRPFGAASLTFARDGRDARAHDLRRLHVTLRGGESSTLVDSDVEDEVDSEDETEDEEEEEITRTKKPKSTLSASMMKAAEKSKAKKISTAKAALNSGLASAATSTASAKRKSSWLKLRLPYILKASFNPVTLFAMTKAYWASLFNLDYPKKEPSQDLRSSVEEKAKKSSGGGSKGKRKFKPGQAKTLSDLPKLNS